MKTRRIFPLTLGALVVLLGLYVLSVGPAWALMVKEPGRYTSGVKYYYAPLWGWDRRSTTFDRGLRSYLYLWAMPPGAHRRYYKPPASPAPAPTTPSSAP